MHRPRNADVARLARVSPATVSLVLNERQDIAIPEATRERVRKAAARLGYRPNKLARSLVQGQTRTLGVIVPRLDSTFSGRIAQGIQEACLEADYQVLLAHTLYQSDLEARQLELLLDHQVEGIICVAGEPTIRELPQRIDRLIQQGIRCLVVDDRTLARRVDCLVTDDIQGARLAVEHLLQAGHRRIAHLSGAEVTTSAQDRLEGYRLALRHGGIPFDPRLVTGGSFHLSQVEPALTALLHLDPRPTALFAVNDEIAAEAWRQLKIRGLRVPQDMALVGYADYGMSHYLGLSTLHQDALEMGRCAARRLMERLHQPNLKPQLLTLPTRLVIRESSAGYLPAPAAAPVQST